MPGPLTVGVIRASLPSYFPEKHAVWDRATTALEALCAEVGADLFVSQDIPMDGPATERALAGCRNEGADFVLMLHGGFTMGDVSRTLAASPGRVGFWSVPEPVRKGDIQLNNFVSLNMSLSIARGVRDLRRNPVQWYHGAPESPPLQARLRNTFRALAAAKALQGARIGVVGGLAMTFYNMEVSTNLLRSRLGVEVAHHDIVELTRRLEAVPDDRVRAELQLMGQAARVDGVSAPQMDLTARCALALRDMAVDNGYAALAASDWPALQAHPGMHPGAAFTWLEEQHRLPVASEGDVLGAVTQIVAKSLTGRVGYLLDMTEPDLDAGQLMMWHGGGGPLYLADARGAAWINHPMIGRGTAQGAVFGAIADLVFRDGPVTVFRIAREGSALFQMTATVAGREPSGFAGCRGWLQGFHIAGDPVDLEDVVASVMAHGLEHHFVLVPGDEAAALAEFGSWTAMRPLAKRPMRDHLQSSDFS
jgi:L-fucose isomerase-like protein